MFEKITFRPQNRADDAPLDIGLLLESMIFYGKVTIVADRRVLKQLVMTFGFDTLNELIDAAILEIVYTESFIGITSSQSRWGDLHSPVIFTSPQHTLAIELRKIGIAAAGKQGKGRRKALQLQKRLTSVQHDVSLADSAKALFLDNAFLAKAVPVLVKAFAPDVGQLDGLQFQTSERDNRILVTTNINFSALNRHYHRYIPETHSSLSSAFILTSLYDIECDLYFASRQLSEIATSPIATNLIKERLIYLAVRCTKSHNQKDSFQDFVFDDSKTIRDAFNSGKIPLASILPVIFKARDFKSWLTDKDIDADLLRAYYKEVTATTIVDKLPARSAVDYSYRSGSN